jgi:hypothetical protein
VVTVSVACGWRFLRRGLWAVLLACPTLAGAGLVEGVKAMPPLKPGAPERTEVLFSVRFPRPDAMEAARAFGATRTVWHYATDAGFVNRLQELVPRSGLTMNANGPLVDPAGRVLDFDGQPLSAPWMKTWGVYWVASTHPASREATAREVNRLVGLGADTLQFDDPTLQLYAGLYQAGDFNPATQRGFRAWLDANAPAAERQRLGLGLGLDALDNDYRAWLRRRHDVKDAADYQRRFRTFPSTSLWLRYLRATVTEHFTWLKQAAAAAAGRPVPLSMNLSGLTEPAEVNPHHFLLDVADFAMSETSIADRAQVVSQWAVARSAGLGSAPSILPGTLRENRTAIAHLYALGATPLVPWDTYNGNDPQGRPQRFFGTPEDYADLFKFVRTHPDLHRGTEVSPTVGVVVPIDANEHIRVRAFLKRLDQRQIPYRFVPLTANGLPAAEADRLQALDHLWLVGTRQQLSIEARGTLGVGALRRLLEDTSISEEAMDSARPVLVAPGQAGIRLVPRVDPDRADRLLLHLIDESRAAQQGVEANCRSRIDLRSAVMDGREPLEARVAQLGGGPGPARLGRTPTAYTVSIEGCAFWTIVDLRLH